MDKQESDVTLLYKWLGERGVGFVLTARDAPWQTIGLSGPHGASSALSKFHEEGRLTRERVEEYGAGRLYRYTVTDKIFEPRSARSRPSPHHKNRQSGYNLAKVEHIESAEIIINRILNDLGTLQQRLSSPLSSRTNAELLAELTRRNSTPAENLQ